MKKSEFKRILKKENLSARRYYLYSIVLSVFYLALLGMVLFFQFNNTIPFNYCLFADLYILIIGVLIVIIDIKNDKDITELYKNYENNKDLSKYRDKTGLLKIIICLTVIFMIIFSAFSAKYIINNKRNVSHQLSITTNKGNVVKTEYQDIGGFSVKIPETFKIMSEAAIAIKYPDGNSPSLVYTNDEGTINIVFNLNDVELYNNQIEEYVKNMETAYLQYADEVDINFFERGNHKIGELRFVSEAIDTNIYNHLIAFSLDDKLRLISFNCTEEFMDEWEEVGEFIINSIKFE